jgi:hypothetical protein
MSENIRGGEVPEFNKHVVREMHEADGSMVPVVLLKTVVDHFEEIGAPSDAAVHAVYEICRNLEAFGWRNPDRRDSMNQAAAVGLRADSLGALVEGIGIGAFPLPTIRRTGTVINGLRSLAKTVYEPSS